MSVPRPKVNTDRSTLNRLRGFAESHGFSSGDVYAHAVEELERRIDSEDEEQIAKEIDEKELPA